MFRQFLRRTALLPKQVSHRLQQVIPYLIPYPAHTNNHLCYWLTDHSVWHLFDHVFHLTQQVIRLFVLMLHFFSCGKGPFLQSYSCLFGLSHLALQFCVELKQKFALLWQVEVGLLNSLQLVQVVMMVLQRLRQLCLLFPHHSAKSILLWKYACTSFFHFSASLATLSSIYVSSWAMRMFLWVMACDLSLLNVSNSLFFSLSPLS